MSGSPFGILEHESSENASEAQVQAADRAAEVQLQMFNTARGDLAPWRTSGINALTQMDRLQSGDYSAFKASPAYQWNLQQGLQAAQRGASATGRMGSGAYLKDLTKYAEGLASNEFSNFYNRYQNMAQLGQAAAAGQASGALQTGNDLANTYQNAGQAQAAGILGKSNAIGNAMGQAGYNVGNWATQNSLANYAPAYGSQWGGWGGTIAGSAEGANMMLWL